MAKGFPMHTMVDRIGQRSGRLTVTSRGPNKADGSAQWWCKCDCGNENLVLLTGNRVKNQGTKSCGCLAEEQRQWIIENQATLLADYRNRPTPMATCHPDLPQAAKGLCEHCYGQLKRTYNPERDKAKAKERNAKPENKFTVEGSKRWPVHLKHLYKITPERFYEMLKEQNYVCACCGKPETQVDKRNGKVKRLQVDHAHSCCPGNRSCGKCIRGLVCWRCNIFIGWIDNNPDLLDVVPAYLRAGGYSNMKKIEEYVDECTIENLGL